MHMYMYTYAYIYTDKRTYIYIYIHMYTCKFGKLHHSRCVSTLQVCVIFLYVCLILLSVCLKKKVEFFFRYHANFMATLSLT